MARQQKWLRGWTNTRGGVGANRIISTSFINLLPNWVRLALIKGYGVPMPEVGLGDREQCLARDKILGKAANSHNGCPLVNLVEEAQKGTLTPEVAMQAVKVTLGLLCNSTAHQSKEHRKMDMNRDVLPLVEEDEMFKGASPILFGDGFEKEHVEAACVVHLKNLWNVFRTRFRKAVPRLWSLPPR